MKDTVLITGANRGIGLALTKEYLGRGCRVYAACRQASDELRQSGAQIIEGVDVTTDAGIEAVRAALGEGTLDLLINNAGILLGDALGALDREEVLSQFTVN